jgi:uncharacterized protein (DUF1330 family)
LTAYAVVRVNVTDPEKYSEYTKRTPAAVAAFGGRFIARGGTTETLEGPTETRRVVVVEFPDFEQAKACFASDQYAEAKSYRIGAAEMEVVIVDGA